MPAGQVLLSAVASSGQTPPARSAATSSCSHAVGQGSSGCRRCTRLTDAEDNGHAACDRLQRDRIEMALFRPYARSEWFVANRPSERPLLQAILRRRPHPQTKYGSAYTVVVKATKWLYGRRASASQPAEPCRREAAPRSRGAAPGLSLSRHYLKASRAPRSSGEAGRPSTSASCRTAAFGCSALIAWFQPVRSTLSAIQGTRQHR